MDKDNKTSRTELALKEGDFMRIGIQPEAGERIQGRAPSGEQAGRRCVGQEQGMFCRLMVQDSQIHYAVRRHGVKLQYFLIKLHSPLLNGRGRMRMVRMPTRFLIGAALGLAVQAGLAAGFQPAAQQFRQEVAQHFTEKEGAPTGQWPW